MPYASLRDFIDRLEASGRLVRVAAPVSPYLEMTEIQTRLLAEGGPAVLFENVVRRRRRANIRCRSGQSVRHRRARRLGHGPRAAAAARDRRDARLSEAAGAARRLARGARHAAAVATVMAMRPRTVGAAPCQEIVLRGGRDRPRASAGPDLLAGRAGAADHLAAGRDQGAGRAPRGRLQPRHLPHAGHRPRHHPDALAEASRRRAASSALERRAAASHCRRRRSSAPIRARSSPR